MDTPEERLILALSQTLNTLQRPLARHTADAGLTHGQFLVLNHLFQKGPVTVSDLLADLDATSGSLSVVIDNLIKAGLLEKVRFKGDRRKRVLCLTDLGTARIEAYAPAYRSELKRLMRDIGFDEKQALLRTLKKLDQRLGIAA